MDKILEVTNLSVSFKQYTPGLYETNTRVVKDLNIDINPGEVFAVFGASGAGKSILASAILDLLPDSATVTGDIVFRGKSIGEWDKVELRKQIAYIPQSVKSLNPLLTIKEQVLFNREDSLDAVTSLFTRFGLDVSTLDKYPHELSGGMARRILAITSLVDNPSFIVADEPTPGMDCDSLDVIVDIFNELKADNKSALVISHDIKTILKVADRVAIINEGEIVEVVDVDAFVGEGSSLSPYTKALWQALPQNAFKVVSDSHA